MLELYNKNEAVDMITVTEILKRDNKLEDVGGIAYVTSLANTVPTAANVTYHASIIEENRFCASWFPYRRRSLRWVMRLMMM